MDRYLIVTYRPDYVDTCMGCRMGETSSDFELIHLDSREEVIEALAQLKFRAETKESDNEFGRRENYLYINGITLDNPEMGHCNLEVNDPDGTVQKTLIEIRKMLREANDKFEEYFDDYKTKRFQKEKIKQHQKEKAERQRAIQTIEELKARHKL